MKQNKVLSSILSNWIPKILSLLLAMFIVLSVRIVLCLFGKLVLQHFVLPFLHHTTSLSFNPQ